MRRKTTFTIEEEEYTVMDCEFCGQEERTEELKDLAVNPEISLGLDQSERMKEVLQTRENSGWVFPDRTPVWDEDMYPTPMEGSYNAGMVKLSVKDMMAIIDESLHIDSDKTLSVCQFCIEAFK